MSAALAADNFEWSSLYTAVSHMMARLGADGSISTDHVTVENVMNALHRLDAGNFVPGLAPSARTDAATHPPLLSALESCAVLFDNIASYEDGHRYTATLGAKGARDAIAAAQPQMSLDGVKDIPATT